MVFFVSNPFISDKYQDITIDGFGKFHNEGREIASDFLKKTEMDITENRALQFIFLVVLQLAFGLTKGGAFTLVSSGAEKVEAYISNLDKAFPGGSTASLRMGQVLEKCKGKIFEIAEGFQDYFYTAVGEWARNRFSEEYRSHPRAMTPPPECFLGLIAPSKLFHTMSVDERGILVPFFNAFIYQHAKHISGTAEFIGLLKTPSFEKDTVIFQLAGKLGFFGGPPGKNMVYTQFKRIEERADHYNALLNEVCVGFGMADLSVVSVDGTNLPVDKRDTTGSIGTGSQGTFFGHKSSIGCEANCIPLNYSLDTGHCSDVTLFPDTINPMNDLANRTGQEIWCTTLDAAYSTMAVINRIESMDIVPIVDINPKNSTMLKKFKEKGQDLLNLVQEGFKNIPRALKRQFREILNGISKKRTSKIPLNEKKSILRALAHLFRRKVLKTGLTPADFQAVEQLRQELLKYRRKIRSNGTPYEKKVGLAALVYGTIEWFLLYSIRGQNEGINGILKKRGDLIGDGQHTSWLIGQDTLSNRQAMDCVGIKFVACVKFAVTGERDNFLRYIHNWRHNKRFFWFVLLVIFSRETPDYMLRWNLDKNDIDLSRFENLTSEFDTSDICITLPPYNIYGLTDYLRRMNVPMKSLLSEFKTLFESANDSIKICSPFLEWGGFNFFKDTLAKKAKKGVRISILSRELRRSESPRRYNEMRKIYHYFYGHGAQSHIEIKNYYFETEEKRLGSSIHAKLIITDDKKA
ncbi:MAG: transposase, partial [Promethearchaeia archaeon]